MRLLKTILCYGLIAAGLVTILLYFFTDFMNWNFFGWFSWLLLALGAWLMNSLDNDLNNFKLLVAVAAADGEVTDKESRMLLEFASKNGISQKELNKIVKEIASGDFKFQAPDSDSKKENIIKKLVEMAKVDGSVDEDEVSLIKDVANKCGLSESFVDNLI